jgi:opacity protein-like surface antigen
MKKLFILLAALCALALPKTIQAMDLEGPYISGISGLSFLNYDKQHIRTDFRIGWMGGLDLGYRFCSGFRVEGEVAYRRNVLHRIKPYHQKFVRTKGNVQVWSFMARGLYELPFDWHVTPYLGAGVGYDNGRGRVVFKRELDGIAWELIGGALYSIDDNLELGLEYIYHQGNKRKFHNNSVGLKLNWFY